MLNSQKEKSKKKDHFLGDPFFLIWLSAYCSLALISLS
jgi:hypothetical protein